LINKHEKRCGHYDCDCHNLFNKGSALEKVDPITYNFTAYSSENERKAHFHENWKLRAMGVLVDEIARKFSKSDDVSMMLAQIYYLYLGNHYHSLVLISNIESHNPPLLIRVLLYYYRLIINIGMLGEAENSSMLLDSLEYQDYFKEFLKIADEITECTIKFWATLLHEIPDMNILNSIGVTIFKSRKQLVSIVDKINKICSNNIEFLVKYGLYMKYIVNDSYNASESFKNIMRSMDRFRKCRTDSNNFSILQSDVKNMMIVISCEAKDFMCMVDANSEAEQMLHVSRNVILGKSITHIMPPMIGEIHDKCMQKFFKSMKAYSLSIRKMRWLKTRDGMYLSCNIFKNIVPRLTGGFLGIMFAHLDKKISQYTSAKKDSTVSRIGAVICDENMKILGFTTEVSKLLSLPERAFTEIINKNTLDYLFPEAAQDKGYEELFDPAGKVLEFHGKNFLTENEAEQIDANFESQSGILMWVRLVKETYNHDEKTSYIMLFSPILKEKVHKYTKPTSSWFYKNTDKSSGKQKKVDLEGLISKENEISGRINTLYGNEEIDPTNGMSQSGSISSGNMTSSSQSSSMIAKEMLDRALASETPSSIKKLLIAIVVLFFIVISLIGIFL